MSLMSALPVAEVAIAMVGDHATLSYRVPSRLRGLLLPGQLVWVPLRNRRVQGVVLTLCTEDEAPWTALREVAELADPEARITSAGLALARWLANTYVTSLYDALMLFLPPGVAQAAEVTWRATAPGLAAELGTLPERERSILYFLRMRGELTERGLFAELRGGPNELREACAMLHERGLVIRGSATNAPRTRPLQQRIARLNLASEGVAPALQSLANAPKQRSVIEWFVAQNESLNPQEDSGLTPFFPVAEVYAATGANAPLLKLLERRGLLVLASREVRRDPLANLETPTDIPPPLTPTQERAWRPIAAALERGRGHELCASQVFLLHGVTGSGKTEIYLRAIARALRLEQQALVLVPEIALTVQLVRRFAARFPGRLAVLHSHLSLGERYDEWRRLRRGEAGVAIGSRSAVFAPLPHLGLIIVDEEHEPTYKHDGSPRYHARDVAIELGALTGAVVILGSATPSVESYAATQREAFQLLEMNERVGGSMGADGLVRSRPLPLPPVKLVDMRRELQSGNRSIFSRVLQQALATTLERDEQAILFLNRRGIASFVLCRDCGYVLDCPACSSPLVVHLEQETNEAQAHERAALAPVFPPTLLVCHSCNYRQLIPPVCPHCMSPRLKSFGIGTQRVVEEVQRLFPQARPLRWDRDSISGKGAHDRMLDRFLRREANVLVGTQMIAKGLDLPLVSLVGVIAADTGLHLPDFRSGERTFQLMTQVAGRAGRRNAGSQVVIQTYTPDHYALRAAQEHDYRAFYLQEIGFRRQTHYPPFSRLVRFVYGGGTLAIAQRAATELAWRIQQAAANQGLSDWGMIGPAPAFFSRVRGRYRWHVLLRIPSEQFTQSVPRLMASLGKLHGWSVDVDPVHML